MLVSSPGRAAVRQSTWPHSDWPIENFCTLQMSTRFWCFTFYKIENDIKSSKYRQYLERENFVQRLLSKKVRRLDCLTAFAAEKTPIYFYRWIWRFTSVIGWILRKVYIGSVPNLRYFVIRGKFVPSFVLCKIWKMMIFVLCLGWHRNWRKTKWRFHKISELKPKWNDDKSTNGDNSDRSNPISSTSATERHSFEVSFFGWFL